MTAQEQLIKYANTVKANSNGLLDKWSPEEIMGKAVTDGIVIARTPSSRTICNATRSGKTIIVTETTKGEKMVVVNGRGVFEPTSETVEVMRIEM